MVTIHRHKLCNLFYPFLPGQALTLHPKATRRKSKTLEEMGADPVRMNRTRPPIKF